jgi:hypothetical protein
MIAVGKLALRTVVKVMSHCSPIPDWNAAVSYQSISTPSKLLLLTKSASL